MTDVTWVCVLLDHRDFNGSTIQLSGLDFGAVWGSAHGKKWATKLYQILTLSRVDWSPGANMMHATIVPTNRTEAYAILVVVELLALGQQAQHKLHAALPKQQATWNTKVTLYENFPYLIGPLSKCKACGHFFFFSIFCSKTGVEITK